MSKELVKRVLMRYEKLKTDKQKWNTMYQKVGEYIRIRKQDFTSSDTQGEFITDDIFDTTAVFANRTMAAALIGALFPNGGKTVVIKPPEALRGIEAIEDFFKWVTKMFVGYMELREAGLSLALDEYMLDAGAFGWGGIMLKNDKEDFNVPLKYINWDAVHTYIDENSYGFIDTIYNEIDMQVIDAANEYGEDKLPKEAKEALAKGKVTETIKVLIAIQPRTKIEVGKKGNKAKPIASIHIAVATGTLLRESGFDENPATMARFSKNSGEVYGRGPGIDSYPDVRMANAQSEAIIRAAEKQLDPPLAILDDGSLGSEFIDTSAGAVNLLSYNGRFPSSQTIFPLYTVGEARSMKDTLQETKSRIMQHFLIDRLLDLNNDTRMTAFETSVRERMRGESLSAVFNRQITEMIDPLIKKSFNALLDRGFLGVDSLDSDKAKKLIKEGVEVRLIPEEILNRIKENKDMYEIEYISPATRILNREEVTSLFGLLEMVNNSVNTLPSMRHYIEESEAIRVYNSNTGGNVSVVRSKEKAEEKIAAEAEANAKAQQADNMNKAAMAVRDGATAAQMMKKE